MNNNIRALRTARGLSQEALGSALNVPRQPIKAVGAGRYAPGLPLAFRLARFFALHIEDVFDDGEETLGS